MSEKAADFAVGDRVIHTYDYKSPMAVPGGAEGVVVEISITVPHIVVDFGNPLGERGCRGGEYLEKLNHDR